MQRGSILGSLLILLLLGCVACGGAEGVPAVAPTSGPDGEGAGTPEGEAADASPRLSDPDLPPTWTPPPRAPQSSEAEGGTEQTQVEPAEGPEAGTTTTSEEVYVVQPGDTLAEIAIQLDVSLADLVTLNDIEDVDHIEVGQRLRIPASE